MKRIFQNLKWWLYQVRPDMCDHSFGTVSKGYRALYCRCCGVIADYHKIGNRELGFGQSTVIPKYLEKK